jgi:hypothetical protein
MVGAVIYVRVSTKEPTENLNLPTQLRACEESCRRQGYEILERSHEEGEGAKAGAGPVLTDSRYRTVRRRPARPPSACPWTCRRSAQSPTAARHRATAGESGGSK